MSETDQNTLNEQPAVEESLLLVSKPRFEIITGEDTEEKLRTSAFDCHRVLLSKIREQKPEMMDGIWTYPLPKFNYSLPRVMPVPKPKPLTTWQKFAKEKNIQKRKRDRLVYDESKDEYVPRFGKASHEEDWIVEDTKNLPQGQDPFENIQNKKTERKSKNELSRLKNIKKGQVDPTRGRLTKTIKQKIPHSKKISKSFKSISEERKFSLNLISSLQDRNTKAKARI
ncbi:Ribosome biogenesis regulatory protein [Thelohanellus kitauei]|uniref:Ribosome biogenesis regulatory protein n=1 Tax=Thelohanellus kitauei TaxID=669202 RepID=A0A0C2IRW8_THEKT|nr:Ribosome biogenesis regulatory protein [Thelohanellus kitauei]